MTVGHHRSEGAPKSGSGRRTLAVFEKSRTSALATCPGAYAENAPVIHLWAECSASPVLGV